MTKTDVTSRELAKLLGLTSSEIVDLRKRKILISGSKRGTYRLQDSVRNYVEHLRRLSAEQESENTVKQPTIQRQKPIAVQAESDSEKSETKPLGVDDTRSYLLPRSRFRLLSKRIRSFRIYIREGRYYTIWDI